MQSNQMYVGMDLNDSNTQISYFREGMKEPLSLSPVAGSERFLIPTVVSKREGMGQWYFGDEALKGLPGLTVDHLIHRTIEKESVPMEGEVFPVRDLLLFFIRKVLALCIRAGFQKDRDQLVITVLHITKEVVELLRELLVSLGLAEQRVHICSYRESYAHFVMNQEENIRNQTVLLFHYWQDDFSAMEMTVNKKTKPRTISIGETVYQDFQQILEEDQRATREEWGEKRDETFRRILDKVCAGKIISGIYLVGTGFDGEWMKHSLEKLATGKRVFQGKNLYTKGACYYGGYLEQEPEYVYIGENKLTHNLCLKVRKGKEYVYETLISAGVNWQDAKGSCEVILKGESKLELFIKAMEGNTVFREILVLEGFSTRQENQPTRLHIFLEAETEELFKVRVKDMGFGNLVPSTNKIWEFAITL